MYILDNTREDDKEVDRIEEYLIRLIKVEDGEVGFTGNAVHTIFSDLKYYFSKKPKLKTVKIFYEVPNSTLHKVDAVVYEDVIDMFFFTDGIKYVGDVIYGSICQKTKQGKYYTCLYNKPVKVYIGEDDVK